MYLRFRLVYVCKVCESLHVVVLIIYFWLALPMDVGIEFAEPS